MVRGAPGATGSLISRAQLAANFALDFAFNFAFKFALKFAFNSGKGWFVLLRFGALPAVVAAPGAV
jgi:hypothetical protein